MSRPYALVLVLLLGCASAPPLAPDRPEGIAHGSARTGTAAKSNQDRARVVLSVLGTNDVHGQAERVAIFGGYVENLRHVRASEGGAVILVDGGDMWQGTLESNLGEGAAMVRAYNVLGYDAATIGNHEFDYGPEGAAPTPRDANDNARGALLARVAEAEFPVLSANIVDASTGERVQWPGVRPSILKTVAGVNVGIVGVSTEETTSTTIAANVHDLRMAPLVATIESQARELRARGAEVVIVAAHAGGTCGSFGDPNDLSSCDPDEEIFRVARGLSRGLVDVIVGGHTHAGVAHRVNGISIIESFARGRAFGRVDLTFDRQQGHVTDVRIHPPRWICAERDAAPDQCAPGPYEGRPVGPHPGVARAIAPALERARARKEQPLGVRLTTSFERSYEAESPLGNLLADLMLAARPDADVALINAGGIRASVPAGQLTYGALYETFPFDNRFATMRLRAEALEDILAANLAAEGGILSVAGIRAKATCSRGHVAVELTRQNGRRITDDESLTVLVSDYLATAKGSVIAREAQRAGTLAMEDGPTIREALAEHLRARGGSLTAEDPSIFDPARPRLAYHGERPVRCEGERAPE